MTNAEIAASITTFTGKRFYLLNPIVEDIDIADIAHATAMLTRWTGHTLYHYSVAQHSVYCSMIVAPEFAFEALMHDASEAYMNDMNRPLKHYTEAGVAYRRQEAVVQGAIRKRFGLLEVEPPEVKAADNQMLFAEKAQIMHGAPWDSSLSIHEDHGTANIKIEKWSPEFAEQAFLATFTMLYKGE